MTSPRTPVDVAAGVLIRRDGRFLLASRPPGKPYASYWEFPGGKVEKGESTASALARELHEELGIDIGSAYPWVVRVFDYPHALVRLHFFRIFDWSGQPHAREHQSFGFFSTDDLPDGPLLPATIPVLRWLELPSIYAISAAQQLGREAFLRQLELALGRGLKLLQFREPALSDHDAAPLLDDIYTRIRAADAKLLVSSRHNRSLWNKADGVHLTAADLGLLERRPAVEWVGASVHSASEIERASSLQLDLVVAGPVRPTASHPHRPPMGWEEFGRVTANAEVPVYALGGLQPNDLEYAMRHRAHGIASLSAIWQDNQCVRFDLSGELSASPSAGPGMA